MGSAGEEAPQVSGTVTLVAAVAQNGVIGREGALPWHLPDDLRRFRRLTTGHVLLMGRRTWASIGRPLPGRVNLVLSRDRALSLPPEVERVESLSDARVRVASGRTLMVIGGGEVYALALPNADRIELTRVATHVAGDTSFPSLDPAQWREVTVQAHPADAAHAYAFEFVSLERV